MALGLSVIFGVVRLVNFAHGEIMTLAMYAAVAAFQAAGPRPASSTIDAGGGGVRRLRLCAAARVHQPFIHRPEHAQFMLLLIALAIIVGNGLLLVFGPDARSVQIELPARLVRARAARWWTRCGSTPRSPRWRRRALLFAFFRFTAHRQGDPRLRRQPARRARRRPARARTSTRSPSGSAPPAVAVAGCADGAAGRRDAGARARPTRCWRSSSSSSAGSARWSARCSAAC